MIKESLGGDVPAMSDSYNGVLDRKIAEVSANIDRMVKAARGVHGGWSFIADSTATVRRFVGRGTAFVPIDDCVELVRVALLNPDGSESFVLATPEHYLAEPMGGTPITGISRAYATFGRGAILAAEAKWGYAVTLPLDVQEATVIEVIRSYLADRVGNDDRLGMTPFGSVVTAKAFTSKLKQLVSDYSAGGGFLR